MNRLVVTLFLLAVASAQAARPWPESSSGTRVFADQLPGIMTEAQCRFAATHLAGTQKLTRSEIRSVRAYNPDFLCLHYQLGVGAGTNLFIDGEDWVSDWDYVNRQTNWFLLNPSGRRVHQIDWNWDVMNIAYSNGTPVTGFPQYWISNCLARVAAAEDDGVFADSFTADAYGFGQANPTHPWLEDPELCQAHWIPQLEAFGRAIYGAFEADRRGYVFVPNLGGLITGWENLDYGLGHGGMIEGFGLWNSGNYFDVSDWQLQLDRALALVRANKIVICQSYPDTLNYGDRMLVLGGYLLIRGARTYLNVLTTGESALEYYPEFDINLGPARSPAAAASRDLWYAPWGAYRRDFTNGVVLVNPADTAVNIPALGASYFRVDPRGGGAVHEDGQPDGTLYLTPVTAMELPAHSGAVLLLSTNSTPGHVRSTSTNEVPAQPTGVSAFHRSGQTFITWNERPELENASYRVYRSAYPLDRTNLGSATLLRQVWEGSANFYANRSMNDEGAWQPRYFERLVVTNRGGPLPAGTGLLVWTLATNDFSGATAGAAYYAVTTVDDSGGENTNDFSGGNVIGPLAESVADPLPVETTVNVGARGHLYIQFMDLRAWNPTFHAPHSGNNYYGLAPDSAAVTNAIQYAYDYVVFEPACASSPAPATLVLHGWADNTYHPVREDPDPWDWCTYRIYPIDQSQTWFFGFARDHDFRRGGDMGAGDTIVNYTEQRLLRMLYDLRRAPPAQAVDVHRQYIYGQSMGGSGTLAMALRYPNVFAAAYASEPMTDYRASGDGGGTDWRDDLAAKWGAIELNLPVALDGPGGWAGPLLKYRGTGVWDWQNHRANVVSRSGDEIVPLGMAHGTNDTIIEWATQGRPVYAAFNRARRVWGGAVSDADHSWLGFLGLPPSLGMDSSQAPFYGFQVKGNESMPGLSDGSTDLQLPPTATGGFNQLIEWASSWNAWDAPPLDTLARWQISLRATGDTQQTVSVTPRRLQVFRTSPGTVVRWTNVRIADGVVLQNGLATADADGLISIANVIVTPVGNRLALEVTSPVPDSAPRIIAARHTEATLEITFATILARRYQLEASDALGQSSWRPAGEPVPGTGGALTVHDTFAKSSPRRFYRIAVLVP